MKRVSTMAAILGAVAVCSAMAHPAHASPSPRPTAAASEASPAPSEAPPVTLADEDAETAPADDSSMEASGDLSEQGALAAIPWRTAFTHNLHNKVVHFPLALGLAAALFLIFAARWPAYAPAARPLLIGGALAAVVAFFSGGAQEAQFDDSPFHSVVEVHQAFGIGSAVTLWAGVFLTFWPRARRFLPLYAVVLILLLACTGFLGGVLSHS